MWYSLPLPALSIWILAFQKFRWEVLTVKYAPRKVYIKENNVYVELSYRDFCRRRESDQRYMDKLFIPVQGCLLEVVREQYADFYRDKERLVLCQKKYKSNVNSTLIFLIILFQFQVFSILSSIFSHVHSAIRNCSDYESLLYYKMFLYTQIQVCTHAYNP